MLNKEDGDVIPHAGKIIDRFGGIRPMASKLQIPVTTVQGWKKRDVIPATRLDDILKAAKAHSVNINGLGLQTANGGPANQNTGATVTAARPATSAPQAAIAQPRPPETRNAETRSTETRGHEKPREHSAGERAVPAFLDVDQLRRDTTRRSLAVSAGVAVVVLSVAVFLFSRDVATDGAAYEGLAGRVANNEARLSRLEKDPGATPGGVSLLGEQVQNMDLSFSQRIAQLESRLGSSNLTQMAQNVEALAQGDNGAQLGQAMNELRGIADSTRGRMDSMDAALMSAKNQNDALGAALKDVSARDVSAAAMLLALYQFRNIVGREEPFERDLVLMKRLAENADPALAESLAKLEPYATTGIMSPQALSSELSGLAGEIALASISGQELSIKDRIMVRLKSLFSIKKDGEAPTAEAKDKQLIAQAQQRFAKGDVRGGLRNLQQLNPQAAETARPVTEKATAYVEALNAQDLLVNTLVANLSDAAAKNRGQVIFMHEPGATPAPGASIAPVSPQTPATPPVAIPAPAIIQP